MKTISTIINTLSEEEQHEFLLFQQKKNRRSDTKNELLFKQIARGNTTNLDMVLYGKPSKNAYHALCKRLQDSLVDFIASKSFANETGEEMDILKKLLAARIFFEHKQYKIGFKTLAQAEKKALALDVYALLTEIYHTQLQYAHLNKSEALPELLKKCKENLHHFKQEQELNMIYATIKNTLQQPQKQPTTDVVQRTFDAFNIKIDASFTYKALFQVLNLTATSAMMASDYYSNLSFMEEVYSVVSAKKEPKEKHLYYHIEILHLMATAHFRNKNFQKSLDFVEKMHAEMTKKNNKYMQQFYNKWLVLKAVNLNYVGDFKTAIQLLKSGSEQSLDCSLALMMGLFQQQQFSEAYQILKTLHHSDVWYEKKMGWIWVLKKSMIEILLLVELDKLEVVLSRLRRFRKKFQKRLLELEETRVLTFVKLVTMYYENPKAVTTSDFSATVERSFEWIGKEREDIFVMSFYAWLKAKMEQRDLYQVTLELVAA
tara:strand:- start:53370 stop:54830 length:1461 start_codon:yes stop_codon:yes gene_type:complete